MPKKIMVQCATRINSDAVRREHTGGVEHVVVSSYTLPDNIVMNGILYPAEEIEKGYESLERTLAPVEHPVDSDGNYISANDPEAIHNFHVGAFNMNVTRENGRVHIEKHINVQEALKTDRGKRLLDRINELETSDSPRPIHTSVGVFLLIEELDKPQVNADGDEYSMIGSDFVFDHDAILLDSVGAATPEQGVGMAVNSEGEKVKVDKVVIQNAVKAARNLPLAESGRTWSKSSALKRVKAHIGAEDAPNATYARYHLWYDAENAENFGAYKLPFVDIVNGKPHAIPAALRNAAARLSQTQGPTSREKTTIRNIIDSYLDKLRTNAEGLSFNQVITELRTLLENIVTSDWLYIEDVYEDEVIFVTDEGFFSVPYNVSGDTVSISGVPIRVEKKVEYQPKIDEKGDERMKDLILNALAEAGISTDSLSDEDLLKAYNELMTASDDDGENGNDITDAIKPLVEKIEELTEIVNSKTEEAKSNLIKIIVDSKKYPGVSEETAGLLPVETLEEMAANCETAYGVPLVTGNTKDDKFAAPAAMPE